MIRCKSCKEKFKTEEELAKHLEKVDEFIKELTKLKDEEIED